MKRLFIVLSVLFFSFLVFAEEGDTGDIYDEDDCGDTGCDDSGDTGDTGSGTTPKEEQVSCENEAGHCVIYFYEGDETNGNKPEKYYHYACISVPYNKAGQVNLGEDVEISEENCKDYLEKECGTKIPTVSDYCGGDERTDICIKYVSESSYCKEQYWPGSSSNYYMTEEEIRTEIDNYYKDSDTEHLAVVSVCDCCNNFNVYVEKDNNCLKEAKCEDNLTEECCKCYLGDAGVDPGDTDVPDTAADTGDTTAEDTADGDSATPATDSEAPAENKEESKSDGCSILFI